MLDGVRENTKRTYKSAENDYVRYCQEYKLRMLPASQETLMMYATHLYKRNLNISSIKVYLFAIRHFHIVNNYNNPMLDSPRLQLVLKAIQRKCVKSADKLPITYDLLKRMYHVLTVTDDHKLMWAAMTLGFFGLLRAAEFTVPSQSKFNTGIHLTMNDVSLRTADNDTKFMSVNIKMSKMDKTCKGYLVHIGCSNDIVCAVCAMISYLSCKSPRSSSASKPLFTFTNGTILTKSMLVNLTRTYLAKIGVDPERYTGHSYRVGGATSGAEAGLSDWEIKIMGRWSSECYQRYIKASVSKIIGFSARMIKR